MKALLLLFLVIISAPAAVACECFMSPIEGHIRATPSLLRGKVLKILDGNTKEGRESRNFRSTMNLQDTISYGYTARILIQEDFKGRFKAGDIINISSTYTTCDILFDVGQEYLLFLHNENNELFTTKCSYSESLATSKDTRKLLKYAREEGKRHLKARSSK
jgi:hypothetical protein